MFATNVYAYQGRLSGEASEGDTEEFIEQAMFGWALGISSETVR